MTYSRPILVTSLFSSSTVETGVESGVCKKKYASEDGSISCHKNYCIGAYCPGKYIV